jgi:ABC-2 type transport system permease protein
VLTASLYIMACSAKNRARLRFQRLREPRYLVGAIVGLAYLYFSIFSRMRGSRTRGASRRRGSSAPPAALLAIAASGPALSGVALLAAAAGSWVMPFDSGLLDFSEAEVQFLFPAPISRRQLLLHRMIRSQLGLLFASVLLGVTLPSVSGLSRLRVGVGMWVLLAAAKVYYTGVSLARARLRNGSPASRRVAWLPVGVLLAAVGVVTTVCIRAFATAAPTTFEDVVRLIGSALSQPLPRLVLWPFMALTRPLFVASGSLPAYLVALGASVLVLLATAAWVLKSDDAFQDAADAIEHRNQRAAKAGRVVTYGTRSAGWTLALTGPAEAALAWKAAMQTLRVVDWRALARIAAALVALAVLATSFGGKGPAALLGGLVLAASIFTILMGPQVLRVDIRQDLQYVELMKTWPVRGATVVRGELVWPGALITAIAWVLIAAATVLSAAVLPKIGVGLRLGAGAALAIVAPALVFAQLLVHNAAALMFPAWVPLGSQRARGLDAMGQRIIMLSGTWLLLVVMALPGALVGSIIWFVLERMVGAAALVPAALACALTIAVEVLLAAEALGPAYDRLDVMAVERVE